MVQRGRGVRKGQGEREREKGWWREMERRGKEGEREPLTKLVKEFSAAPLARFYHSSLISCPILSCRD